MLGKLETFLEGCGYGGALSTASVPLLEDITSRCSLECGKLRQSFLPKKEKSMTKKILMITVAMLAAFVFGAVVFSQQPPVNVGERHGNMRAAQQLIQQAWQKVDEAQKDNNYNLGGHAGRAKELLSQASEEIRLSADVANSHR